MEVGGKVSIERLLADLNLDVEDIPTKQKVNSRWYVNQNIASSTLPADRKHR